MGLFDKVKTFFKPGVKVQITEVERNAPQDASMPATDTVVKGKFQMTCEKKAEILQMDAVVFAKHKDAPEIDTVELGRDTFPDPYTSRSDDMLQYPFTLTPGDGEEDFFIISLEKEIPALLEEKGWSLQEVEFTLSVEVDVKGSPFDPEAQVPLRITE